jgi:hypothetical protein
VWEGGLFSRPETFDTNSAIIIEAEFEDENSMTL